MWLESRLEGDVDLIGAFHRIPSHQLEFGEIAGIA
jgi:hypothetical protein